MKKRGFTLVELLAVIVILAIILAIAVPAISNLIENSRVVAYQNSEKMLASAARNYLAGRNELIPSKVNNIYVISSGELITNGFLSNLKDVTDSSSTCDGYVIVKRISDANHELQPYMKCGSNYRTTDYADANLATVEVLVVAGGGAAATGGGGGGGVVYNSEYKMLSNNSFNVTVGAGGTTTTQANATNGGNSTFATITAIGGGRGGQHPVDNASSGGSGGGGATDGNTYARRSGTSGQGNYGGISIRQGYGGGGGGGGAGAAGTDSFNENSVIGAGGNGGNGIAYSISGTSVYYGGGGGGANTNSIPATQYGFGGLGGGANGSRADKASGNDAAPNTGGGGGGCDPEGIRGGNGGSGIIIVRYLGHQKANGGAVTYVNGYTIHTFTNVGNDTLTVLTFE